MIENFEIKHKDNNESTFLDAAPKISSAYFVALTEIFDNQQLKSALEALDLNYINDASKLRVLYENRDYKTIINKTRIAISATVNILENVDRDYEPEHKALIENLLKFLTQFLELVIDIEKQGEFKF